MTTALFSKKSSAVSAPAVLVDDPAWLAATEAMNKITARQNEIESRLDELRQAHAAGTHAKVRATAIAAGQPDPGPLASNAKSEAGDLQRELQVLQQAHKMACENQHNAMLEASRAACKARNGDYLAIARDIAAALKQLKAGLLAESQFRQKLAADGFDFKAPLIHCAFIAAGQDTDYPEPFWQINEWFKGMAENGVKFK